MEVFLDGKINYGRCCGGSESRNVTCSMDSVPLTTVGQEGLCMVCLYSCFSFSRIQIVDILYSLLFRLIRGINSFTFSIQFFLLIFSNP